jgi:broad specificity phosphatase PhoE
MEKKTVILVRHGESTANRDLTLTGQTDPELTPNGVAQAKRAARYIADRLDRHPPVDVLYTSPLKRAVRTAELIAKRLKTPLLRDELLMETDFGSWEDLRKDELAALPGWDSYTKDPFHFRFPGGESPQDVKSRAFAFKDKLRKDGAWRKAVVVAHYTPLVFLILGALGGEDARQAPFRLDNGAVSVIELDERFEILTMLNFVP